MWKKTCWKERFQLGVAYWPLQGGHAKTFLTTVCCFGFSCSRLYENRQQTAAMQDWDILYTQTAHILYRGSKCCTHWPQIGGAGDTGHTPDTAIPQKLPTFVSLHQNIHTLCWSDLKVTVHKYANPTIQRYCCPSQYVLISISIPLGRSSIQSFVHLAQLWLDAEAAGQRGPVLH